MKAFMIVLLNSVFLFTASITMAEGGGSPVTANLEITLNLDNKKIVNKADTLGAQFLDNLNSLTDGSAVDREQWVKTVRKHFATAFPKHAIMVIHSGQELISAPDKAYMQLHLEQPTFWGSNGFEVFVIRKGSGMVITNKGDGGYINWNFSGHKERDGKTVTF